MAKIKTTVTIEVEIKFPDGPKTIGMIQKRGSEIEDCEEGKVIVLILTDGQELTGIFGGMADEDVKIEAIGGRHVLGYNVKYIDRYFEEIKP